MPDDGRGPRGWSATLQFGVGFDASGKLRETSLRQLDILQGPEATRVIEGLNDRLYFVKPVLEGVNMGTVLEGASGKTIPQINGGSAPKK
jgi:hypothetical protein